MYKQVTAYFRHDGWTGIASWIAGGVIILTFALLITDIALQGLDRISWSFLTQAPVDAGRAGGIWPILLATLLLLAVALGAALPLGIGTALFLAEQGRRTPRLALPIRRSLDILAAVPSIVFGLFGNALFAQALGLGYSILSGGLTLACMILPVLIRTTEIALLAVPRDYHLGAAALALSRWSTLRHITLRAAMPGIIAGVLLGISRAVSETAALIFTSGYVDRLPGSLLDSGRAISVHIYDLAMNVPGGNASANASALVLIGAVLIINVGVFRLAEHFTYAEKRL